MKGSQITLRSKEARMVNLIANAGMQYVAGNVDWFQETKNYINGILVNTKGREIVDAFISICEKRGALLVRDEILKYFKQS